MRINPNSNDYDAPPFEKFSNRRASTKKAKETQRLEDTILSLEEQNKTLSSRLLSLSHLTREIIRSLPTALQETFSLRLREALSVGDPDFEVHP